MLTLAESFFYADPADPKDAPEMGKSSGRSRAIDIVAILNSSTPARISYNASSKLDTASELSNTTLQSLLGAPESLAGQGIKPLDRIYYENNWGFARSLLCRKHVKDVLPNFTGVNYEDPDLMHFELFLNTAAKRNDLSFISRGRSTSDGKLLASNDRVLYHFGFDWLGILRERSINEDETLMHLRYAGGDSYMVRRTTAVAIAIRLASTDQFTSSPLCPKSWTSNNQLDHRRTVILFNELHSSNDTLPFTAWISPDARGSSLWDLPDDIEARLDTDYTALAFIQKFVARMWQGVVSNLEDVIDECSKHIIYREQLEFYMLNVDDLERIAENTWRDILMWHVVQKLIAAQRESVSNTTAHLTQLAQDIGTAHGNRDPVIPVLSEPLLRIIEKLAALEKTVAEDFRSRSQSISDLIYNIINVRNAQAAQRTADAAQQESRDLGRISWITFIFFPLISVSGIFGMNVDILVNTPPSIAWFFIVGVPATILVLLVAFLFNLFFKWRTRRRELEAHEKYA